MIANTDIALPSVNNSALSGGFFSGVNDALTMGLDTWLSIEKINMMKDAAGSGQANLNNTVEVTTPQVVEVAAPANTAQNQAQVALAGLKIGTGTIAAVVGGVAVLWYLSRK